MGFIAAVASTTAFGTAVVVTLRAAARALVTGRTTTTVAGAGVVVADVITTIRASAPRPLFESDVGTAGVVRLQNLSHEQKEVAQPSLLQRRTNRGLAIPFAQPLALDMRMRYVVVTRGWVGFESDDLIRSLMIEPVPMQHDLKRSQADVFQRD